MENNYAVIDQIAHTDEIELEQASADDVLLAEMIEPRRAALYKVIRYYVVTYRETTEIELDSSIEDMEREIERLKLRYILRKIGRIFECFIQAIA